MDGKFRRIKVKLLKGKYTVAYRRGYFADDLGAALAAGQELDSDPLRPLIGRNLPDYRQILYKILVQPSNPQPPADAPRAGGNAELKGPFSRYGVDFAVAPEDLKLTALPTASFTVRLKSCSSSTILKESHSIRLLHGTRFRYQRKIIRACRSRACRFTRKLMCL